MNPSTSSTDKRSLLESASVRSFVLPDDWSRQNAVFTLLSTRTRVRFTFKVSAPRVQKEGKNPILFVSLLSGPDNQNDYRYMGLIIDPSEPKFITTRGSQVSNDAPSMKAFRWALPRILAGEVPDSLQVWHEGRCCRCGRALTVPESIESGIGPVCASR